jgi:hypothetical protein
LGCGVFAWKAGARVVGLVATAGARQVVKRLLLPIMNFRGLGIEVKRA